MSRNLIKILLIVLICLIGRKVFAYDLAVKNQDGVVIFYNYINDGKELEVVNDTRPSQVQQWWLSDPYRDITNLKIPAEVTYLNRTRKVTSIRENTFAITDYDMTSISIPKTINHIGDNAFSNCYELKKVIVEDIGAWCTIDFEVQNDNLHSPRINNPLYYAKHLYSDENTEIKDLIIPEGPTKIGKFAFINCLSIKSVLIPNTVKSIEENAFENCSNIVTVSNGDGVVTIGDFAFENCESLKYYSVGNSLKSISAWAFYNCFGLCFKVNSFDTWCMIEDFSFLINKSISFCDKDGKKITELVVSDNISSIKPLTFQSVHGIKKVIISDHVSDIGGSAFLDCSDLEKVILGDNISSIKSATFRNCSQLSEVQFGRHISKIGNGAFEGSGIISLILPASIKEIGESSFSCKTLTSVTIPNSVTSIGRRAFYSDCLSTIISLIKDPFPLKDNPFGKNTLYNATLYVPKGTIDKYKATDGWRDFVFIEENDNGNVTKHKITYLIDGEEYKSCEIEEGSYIYPEPIPSKDGYSFSGWSEIPEIMPDHDVIVTGKFTMIPNSNDGDIPDEKVVFEGEMQLEWGQAISLPANLFTDLNSTSEIEVTYTQKYDQFSGDEANSYLQFWYNDWSSMINFTADGQEISETLEVNKFYNSTSGADHITVFAFDAETFKNIKKKGLLFQGHGILLKKVVLKAGMSDSDENGNKNEKQENEKAEIDGSNYLLDFQNMSAEITSGNKEYSGVIVIPSLVNYDGKIYIVTSIGDNAFHRNSTISSVTIPNTVTSIGESSFGACTYLTSITIPNSVIELGPAAFYGCSALMAVDLPSGLKRIENNLFWGCTDLTSVTIPEGVTSIGEEAFRECIALPSIIIPNSVTKIGNSAFSGCTNLMTITIGSGVTTIDGYAFANIFNKTETRTDEEGIEVYCYAEKVPNTDENAFDGTPTEKSTLHVPASMIEKYRAAWPWSDFKEIVPLGNSSFTQNGINYAVKDDGTLEVTGIEDGTTIVDILSDVYIDGNTYQVSSIGERAFEGRSDIEYLSIPWSVKSIGEYAFIDCGSNLTVNIADPESWCKMELVNEHSSPLSSARKVLVFDIETDQIDIPEGVTSIGNFTFYQCRSITSLNISNTVKSIGSSAFEDCTGLTSLNIKEGLESIEGSAFEGCSGLSNLSIPSTVNSIKTNAFRNCKGITDVYCYAEIIPDTEFDAFDATPTEKSTLHVPASMIEKYRAAWPWSDFKEIIALEENPDGIMGINQTNDNNNLYYDLTGRKVLYPQKGLYIKKGKKVIVK